MIGTGLFLHMATNSLLVFVFDAQLEVTLSQEAAAAAAAASNIASSVCAWVVRNIAVALEVVVDCVLS